VFDATLGLLAEHGYQALTIEAVASEAGVNKTTVYRNWPTKAALVRAAAEDRSATAISTRATGDARRDLTVLLQSVADYVTSPLGQALVIAALNESHDPEVRQARAAFWDTRFAAVRDLVRSATGCEADEVDEVTERLIGPVFLRAFVTGVGIDEGFVERTVDAVLSGR
jgi:AcrR family transcriptional regulator